MKNQPLYDAWKEASRKYQEVLASGTNEDRQAAWAAEKKAFAAYEVGLLETYPDPQRVADVEDFQP